MFKMFVRAVLEQTFIFSRTIVEHLSKICPIERFINVPELY